MSNDHLVEFRDDAFVWPKGSTYWGAALPHLETDKAGKRWVAYGPWWNEERIAKLSEWSGGAIATLQDLCGDDRRLHIRAEAKVRGEALRTEGGQLDLAEMLASKWQPTPLQSARIDDLVEGYVTTREWIRNWLWEAAAIHDAVADDLPGEPPEWTALQMAFAAVRIPPLLRKLVERGEMVEPAGVMPVKATV